MRRSAQQAFNAGIFISTAFAPLDFGPPGKASRRGRWVMPAIQASDPTYSRVRRADAAGHFILWSPCYRRPPGALAFPGKFGLDKGPFRKPAPPLHALLHPGKNPLTTAGSWVKPFPRPAVGAPILI